MTLRTSTKPRKKPNAFLYLILQGYMNGWLAFISILYFFFFFFFFEGKELNHVHINIINIIYSVLAKFTKGIKKLNSKQMKNEQTSN